MVSFYSFLSELWILRETGLFLSWLELYFRSSFCSIYVSFVFLFPFMNGKRNPNTAFFALDKCRGGNKYASICNPWVMRDTYTQKRIKIADGIEIRKSVKLWNITPLRYTATSRTRWRPAAQARNRLITLKYHLAHFLTHISFPYTAWICSNTNYRVNVDT